jgi:hypothetical protein
MLVEQFDPFPPRDQMDVGVQDGLSGRYAAVDTDIEPLYRRIVTEDLFPERQQYLLAVMTLLVSHAEIIQSMAKGDNQEMAIGHRIPVLDGKNRPLLHQDVAFNLCRTELAGTGQNRHMQTPVENISDHVMQKSGR